MAEQTHIQRLRGDTTKNDNYTGLNGEVTINSTTQVTRLHDGIKKGGYGQAFAAHYDTLPATVPNDLHEGAIVIEGDGAIEGGVSIINAMPYNTREILTTSGTYTAPVTGWYKATCIGGGEGGSNGTILTSYAYMSGKGGRSGEIVANYVYLVKNTSYKYTIGAGGSSGQTPGVGGTTTFVGLQARGGNPANTGLVCCFGGHRSGGATTLGAPSTPGGGFGGCAKEDNSWWYGAGGPGGFGASTESSRQGEAGYQGCVILEYYDPDKAA